MPCTVGERIRREDAVAGERVQQLAHLRRGRVEPALRWPRQR